jgi:hypothetical protein
MKITPRLIVLALFIFPGTVHANDTTDLIQKAITYQSTLSIHYDVIQTFKDELRNTASTSNYSVLKKGAQERIQDKSGKITLKHGQKEKQLMNNNIVDVPVAPSFLESLLEYCKNGVTNATISTKNNKIVVKGKKDEASFKIVFHQEPVLLLEFEAKNKNEDNTLSWKCEYDFDSNPPKLLEETEASQVIQKGRVVAKYKKTLRYHHYTNTDTISESVFSENALKTNVSSK